MIIQLKFVLNHRVVYTTFLKMECEFFEFSPQSEIQKFVRILVTFITFHILFIPLQAPFSDNFSIFQEFQLL